MDPPPYNVTITSRTASVIYSPTRESWNVTYSNGIIDGGQFGEAGLGIGSHSTRIAGATMQLSWVGTAIYLYGESTRSSYKITVDGVDVFESLPPDGHLEPGLLGLKTGLSYGRHTAVLTVVGGDTVTFKDAMVTIGIGYEESSTSIQYRIVPAVVTNSGSDQLVRNDDFFTFNRVPSASQCDWKLGAIYPSNLLPVPVPRQVINPCGGRSDSVTFRVNQTSAFFLFGTLHFNHQWKKVTMKPGLNGDSLKITYFNDFSRAMAINQILYWESGLDRDQEYEVQIAIEDKSSGQNMMSFHTLKLIDGGPRPVATESSHPSTSSPPSPSLSSGTIAGIVVGSVLLFLVSSACVWCIWRRRRLNPPELSIIHVFAEQDVERKTHFRSRKQETPSSPLTPSAVGESRSTVSLARERDAGPAHFAELLPPEYDQAWLLQRNSTLGLSRLRAGTMSRGSG